MSKSIMIICAQSQGEILPVTQELITCANRLADYAPAQIKAVLPAMITDVPSLDGVDLLVINSPALAEYSSEGWEKAALMAAEEVKPHIIIIAHTSSGYDYAPRLAAHLDASCLTSVNGVELVGDKIRYRRSGFHGKVDVLYEAGQTPLVLTVLPGAFPAYEPPEEVLATGTTRIIKADINLTKTKNIELTSSDETNTELDDAEVIVGVGRGIGKAENLALIHDLAACFNRSAVAGSRVACDNGWIKHNAQIGITGKKVSPQLYIACGISGTIQHVVGIQGAQTIVAINRDPEAAIFSYADICIVEELEKFIPAFLDIVKK